MKKKIYPMLFVAALSLSACTEVLEPNVDYGGNTFINDYSALYIARPQFLFVTYLIISRYTIM